MNKVIEQGMMYIFSDEIWCVVQYMLDQRTSIVYPIFVPVDIEQTKQQFAREGIDVQQY